MLVFKMFVVKLNISIIFYLHYINVQSAFAEAPRQGFVQHIHCLKVKYVKFI